jgi:hypothetical protein
LRPAILIVALLCLILAAPAGAAEPTAAEIAVARRLYAEAVQLEEAGKWAEAEKKLREAIAIKETPGLRFHVAVAQEKQGKLVEALVDYDRAHEMIERGSRAPDVEQLLGPARESVRGRIPALTVNAPPTVRDAALSIDDKQVAQTLFGQPIPLNPGRHTVRVEAPGHDAFETELTLAESEKKTLEPELAPNDAPAAGGGSMDATTTADVGAGADEPATGGSSTKTIVLIGGAAFTVVALATGIGFTVYKGRRQEEVDQAQAVVDGDQANPGKCPSSNSATQDACDALPDLIDQRDQASTFATVGFIAAGVGAVATVATYFLWNPEPERSTARFGVAPIPGGAALGVSGSF